MLAAPAADGWRWAVQQSVHGQAVGMEGDAGSPRPVLSGSVEGAAAQHSVQPTGEDLGWLTMLAAPAADGWRWAASLDQN